MKFTFSILLIIIPALAQSPLVENIISFSKAGTEITLNFGIDPSATDNLDQHLNEFELPPLPPSSIFDVRFVGTTIGLDLGNGTLKDFRFGDLPLQQEIDHEIYLQNQNNDDITINWNFSEGVSALLTDFFNGSLVYHAMEGTGSSILNIGFLTNLKLKATYNILTRIEKSTDNRLNGKKILVYPNPFNNISNLEIYSERADIVEINLVDILGRSIKKEKIELHIGQNHYPIKLTNQPSGIYFLVIGNPLNFYSCKLILTK